MNKRIRCNEYIASLLSKEFSRRLNRIISLGDKATIESMRELFRILNLCIVIYIENSVKCWKALQSAS